MTRGDRLRNFVAYKAARLLRKTGLPDITMRIGARSRCVIPEPPGGFLSFLDRIGEDATLRAVLRSTAGAETFWDVGANAGYFSILARDANPRLRVVSIEPSSDHYSLLCRNWRLRSDGWICLHTAVGEADGRVVMTRGLGGYEHVVAPAETVAPGGAVRATETRPITTLDRIASQLGETRLDVLKIDVEGMELPVLLGAAGLLGEGRVGVVILEADGHEARYGLGRGDPAAFMESMGYTLDRAASAEGSTGGNYQVYRRGADRSAA